MRITIAIVISLLVAWRSFHFFFEDFYDFLSSFGKARGSRNYYLWWKEPRQWSEAATACAKVTLYLALVMGSGFLTYYSVRKIFSEL